ncbi:hypothetical protein [uncultured Lutibacter sp.]|uniref:hypothetical protein n=1 Tax=uncultured Lutibacter sp. TaxID=437739 RepID=UPI00260894A8|nr:hypothetical protein [uncultured Lutibacter sp.]
MVITDYTVVAKFSMSTENEMSFFLSDLDGGVISALEYFAKKDSVATFYNRHNIDRNEDYKALFKVT